MNKITDFTKTIVALATALGSGSIAIIRISGKQAISIVNKIFSAKDLKSAPANTIHYGKIITGGHGIDEVLVYLFKAPRSYTGEDYIEISCHANPYIVDELIELLIRNGAYMAKPGEFTLRAFLNGKLDLSQAEAVANIITAKSKFGLHNSIKQLGGELATKINEIKNRLVDIVSFLEIDLDFSEENIEIISPYEIVKKLSSIENELKNLVKTFNYAKIFNSGLQLVIAGIPNSGKSTLMNALLGEGRAITSHIPGTTRDPIHENILLKNIYFKLIDTAGLRKTANEIENEGIKRTKLYISHSDIVLMLMDISEELSNEAIAIVNEQVSKRKSKVLLVANKIDKKINKHTLKRIETLDTSILKISAKTGEGLDGLKDAIINIVSKEYEKFSDQIVISSQRHKEVLDNAVKSIKKSKTVIKNKGGYEFAVIDLRAALDFLGEITGETATEDILNNIFSNFCIGK